MLKAHDRVIAGISGGADSLCLLFLLLEWAKRVPLDLAVVHVNHGIRREAGEDACYVVKICAEQGVPFYLIEENVRERARTEKCSEEEAGRNARYEAFFKTAREFQAEKIAVAHNKNDCSETMLFHLFRGSGLKGLCGILPVRENIIRPLLCLERQEIEEYLRCRGVPWREDATNSGDDYTRNRIRHHILAYAEKEISSGCVSHMAQTARMLAETEGYLEEQTLAAAERCGEWKTAGEPPVEIHIESFQKEHAAMQKRMLLFWVKSISPSAKDISYVHIQSLLTLFDKEGNRTIHLPFGIRGRREYDRVILERSKRLEGEEPLPGHRAKELQKVDSASMDKYDDVVINMEGLKTSPLQVCLGDEGKLEFSILSREDLKDFPEKECTKWFDCDKIRKSLVVRTRRTGDYFTIADGRGGQMHKSVKDYMITAKIPRDKRDELLLLAEDQHVLWLIGWRISEQYKIRGDTKHILQVQLRRGGESGKMEENYGGKS